jgi:hypothetical protein
MGKSTTAKQLRLLTGQLGELGENLIIPQLLARGRTAAYKLPLCAPADDLVVHLEGGKELRLQVKTRRTGTWQATYEDAFGHSHPKRGKWGQRSTIDFDPKFL